MPVLRAFVRTTVDATSRIRLRKIVLKLRLMTSNPRLVVRSATTVTRRDMWVHALRGHCGYC